MARSNSPAGRIAPAGLIITLMLAGCANDRAATGTTVAPASTPEVSDAMAGRWQLAAIGSSMCTMTFGGAPGATDGTIAPEGGCPGNFFTSRKWTLERGALIIRDHNGAPLGEFTQAAPGRFDGKATNGIVVTLTR